MKFLTLSFFLISFSLQAQEIQKISNAFLSASFPESENHLVWDVVRVRAILEMEVNVPLVTKISVNPEIELYFTKK